MNIIDMIKEKKEIKMRLVYLQLGGNIVGEHSVQFFGEFETLEITHTSYSRSVFAEGAVKAAEFIYNKSAGIYTMKNLT